VSFMRRLSTRRLLAVIAGTVLVLGGGAAIAIAATSSTSVPAKKALPVAVRQALTAPAVQGVTARIKFTNTLIDASSFPGGTPLLTGATGRLWASADGKARLELQSSSGKDAQILVDNRTVSLYDASAKTQYTATLPKERGHRGKERKHGIPTIAAIKRALKHLARGANISGATPTNVAGREAYEVKLSPKRDGGLVGAAKLAWDAANGVPLRIGVYAAGKPDPVLELAATDIDYGPVDTSAFDVHPPAGTKVVNLSPKLKAAAAKGRKGKARASRQKVKTVKGAKKIQAAAGFPVSAPKTLAGLPRKGVRLITVDGKNGVVAVYGKGLGAIAVLEGPADATKTPAEKGDKALPAVSINGATGTELATALGTLVTFERSGVSYTVVGSVPAAAAEAAARGL
jgi:outer membrane lipoprotein-sorting protein